MFPVGEASVRDAVAVLSVPRAAAADSFVLHAPLELMARFGLLSFVREDLQGEALARIAFLAAAYEASGPAVASPRLVAFESVEACAVAIVRAIAVGDLVALDAALVWFGNAATPVDALRLFGESVADATSAAGHVPIGLHLLVRLDDATLPVSLLRGPLRELARFTDQRVRWFRNVDACSGDLADALRRVPRLGSPSRISSLMATVERSGWAAEVGRCALGADLSEARRTLLRAAAWSMAHDDPTHAAYGWSHCLTLPQALLALAGRGVQVPSAIGMAATFVSGFRFALGREPIGDLSDHAWTHWPNAQSVARHDVTAIATEAALHKDAHVAKYALACIHAAQDDPPWGPAYLAAAAHLCAWWRNKQ